MLSKTIRAVLAFPSRRAYSVSKPLLSDAQTPKHTPDSYAKDVDPSGPVDPAVYRVDPNSESVQKPYEPPSGEWSRAGTRTSEYQSMSTTEPYKVPGQDQRYGGKEALAKDKGPETSKPNQGPEGTESGGRKPGGR